MALVVLSRRIRSNDFFQNSPIGTRTVLWNAPAAFQIEVVHLFGDVLGELGAVSTDSALKSGRGWAGVGHRINIVAIADGGEVANCITDSDRAQWGAILEGKKKKKSS